MIQETIVLPFSTRSGRPTPVSAFRTTWLVSSLQTLRERGHFDEYLRHLPPERHDEVLHATPGAWVGVDVARAHYEACNRLSLTSEEQVAMGRGVGALAQRSVLSTVAKVARETGGDAWIILSQLDRLWARGFQGGDVCVRRVGPKDARVEIVACELFGIPYFRNAFRGILLDSATLFCTKAYVHDRTPTRGADEVVYRTQWA